MGREKKMVGQMVAKLMMMIAAGREEGPAQKKVEAGPKRKRKARTGECDLWEQLELS